MYAVYFNESMDFCLKNDLREELFVRTTFIDEKCLTTVVQIYHGNYKLLIDLTFRGHESVEFDQDENANKLRIVGFLLNFGDYYLKDRLNFVCFIRLNWLMKKGFLRVKFKFSLRIEDMLEGEVRW